MPTLKETAREIRDGVKAAPWYVKLLVTVGLLYLGIFVVAYALNPIDLIPDFIPALGQLEDALLIAGLLKLVRRYGSGSSTQLPTSK